MKTKITFLDYTIQNTGNSDGFVIFKDQGKLYECNLGNYATLDDAKKYALIYFLIARPETFATQIAAKITGRRGTYMEFYLLKRVLDKLEIEIPKEISGGDDANMLICYNNEPLTLNK